MTDPSTLAGELSDEERRALVMARDATYAPGVLATKLRSDGQHNPSGWIASRMLDRLTDRGLLKFDRVVGPESIDDIRARGHIERDTTAYYSLTPLGLAVAKHLERDNG